MHEKVAQSNCWSHFWDTTGSSDLNYCDQIEAELRRKEPKNDIKHQRKTMYHTEQRDVLQYFKMEGTQRQMAVQQKRRRIKQSPLLQS